MTIVELNAKKAELIKSILNDINSEDILNEISKFVKSVTVKAPCQYTPEEIQSGALKAIEEAESGGGIPHSQIKRKTA